MIMKQAPNKRGGARRLRVPAGRKVGKRDDLFAAKVGIADDADHKLPKEEPRYVFG
jgi:hypothetical protein